MLKLDDFNFSDYDNAVGYQLCYNGKEKDYEIWQSASGDFCISIQTYTEKISYNTETLSKAIQMIEEEEQLTE